MSHAKAETLSSAVLAPLDAVRSVILIISFSLLTAICAQVSFTLPFTPIPVTGQTFAVLLTGALLGPRLGALAMIVYLLEGASGLPFFTKAQGGPHYLLLSPTAGYLFSYPFAAFVTGYLAERGWDRRFPTAVAAMALGSTLILLGGWAWLAVMFRSASMAYHLGVEKFLIGDAVKSVLAAATLPVGWSLLRLRRGES